MKYLSSIIKTCSASLLVILLANCASHESHYEEVVTEVESSKIVITGSRIKRTDTESTTPVAATNLTELLALTRANRVKTTAENKQREQEFLLSKQQQTQLDRAIALDPSASNQIFKRYRVNPTIQTEHNAVSTFSMDVDNGSYHLAAAMLQQNKLPNPDGIRIEEFVNAMTYQYNQNDQLFSVSAEAMPSPFRHGYHILHLGLQTKNLNDDERSPSNLVMVTDISGSMDSDNKLALLKNAMTTLISQLSRDDQVALVVYNDNARVALAPTNAANKRKIFSAINQLKAGGSTNAEQGLLLGYQLAEQMYQPGFNNRVILTSDGMANVGSTSPDNILSKIKDSKNKGIFLTTLGVGLGMYNDHLLEQLADQGNGNYLYVANQQDIQTAFVDHLNRQLQTVAKDAKIQVTFEPSFVESYRLLGYENRHLEQQDFTDASKDGGEIGAGHRVTALYEIKLKAEHANIRGNTQLTNQPLANLSIAYKKPQGNNVFIINKKIPSSVLRDESKSASPDSQLSYAVAAFAEKLRQSYWSRFYSYQDIQQQLVQLPLAFQQQAQVIQLTNLLKIAQQLDDRTDPFEKQSPIAKMNFDRVPLLD